MIKGKSVDYEEVTVSRSTSGEVPKSKARYLTHLSLNRDYFWEKPWFKKTHIHTYKIVFENK